MSGHSKWANTKHRKLKEDARRGQVFTKIAKQLIVAAREGGPDPDGNFKLRLAVDKAKAANMPNENIQRAIRRGSGGSEGDHFEQVIYEGYGPAGVAVLVETATDNRNRTTSDVRFLFNKHGGSLGEVGCVSWMFDQKGVVVITRRPGSASPAQDEDEVLLAALEAGAEDVRTEEEFALVLAAPKDLEKVRMALDEKGFLLESASLKMVPKSTVEASGKEAESVVKLVGALEEHDDVQEVYTNADIPDEIMEAI